MIEQAEIEGKSATVIYMTKAFVPVDKEKAELIKVVFDDGRVVFAVPTPGGVK